MALEPVHMGTLPCARFAEVLGAEQLERLRRAAATGRELFAGRVLWTVNSTARGGGVAELLTLDAFGRAAAALLTDPERAQSLGIAATERVRDSFLGSRTLEQYVELFQRLLAAA